MAAFTGPRVLTVDLGTREYRVETLDPELVARFCGGRGIGAYLLWQLVTPDTEPLSPQNPLIFATGALTGTVAPCSGRTSVHCKSPATAGYLKSSVGGHWGAELRYAGYDCLVVRGAAEAPVYLLIEDGRVELRDAGGVWGMCVSDACSAILEELEGRSPEMALIGPAGEAGVKFAAIMMPPGNAAARGGPGCVMGSKRLKGIVVEGHGAVHVADMATLVEVSQEVCARIYEDRPIMGLHRFGTAGLVEPSNALNQLPCYNFQKGSAEGAYSVSGPELTRLGIASERRACTSCVIGCHLRSRLDTGRYQGTLTYGPEYESVAALGTSLGIFDPDVLVRACFLCNELGLDTISAGGVIGWAMESVERGCLSPADLGGLELAWGNGEAVLELLGQIARREGLGGLLADGVQSAASSVGGESDHWAVQAKGLEQSRVDTRASKGYALAFAVNPRGPDHLHTAPQAELGGCREWEDVIKEITGDEKYADPLLVEKRAEIVVWHEDWYADVDSLGLCAFTEYVVDFDNMSRLFAAATGLATTPQEMALIGRRVVTLERAFNMREGHGSRVEDVLPRRMMHESLDGLRNSPEELGQMLDEYYALHGWDVESGLPTRKVLEELDLAEVADELERSSRLQSTDGEMREAARPVSQQGGRIATGSSPSSVHCSDD